MPRHIEQPGSRHSSLRLKYFNGCFRFSLTLYQTQAPATIASFTLAARTSAFTCRCGLPQIFNEIRGGAAADKHFVR
jgi:hypothetical protein